MPRSSASSTGSSRSASCGCDRRRPLFAGRVALVTGGGVGHRARDRRTPRAEGASVVIADIDGERRREGRRRRSAPSARWRSRSTCSDETAVDGGVRRRGAPVRRRRPRRQQRRVRQFRRAGRHHGRRLGPAARGAGTRFVPREPRSGAHDDGEREWAATSCTWCRRTASSPGRPNVAYGAAKADQAHQVRLLAAELGRHGIRVNGVNPDGVVEGSGIFSSAWREARAAAHGVEPDRLGEFYASRTLLGEEVLPRACRRRRRRAHRRRRSPGRPACSCRSTAASRPRSCDERTARGTPMTMQITAEQIVERRGGPGRRATHATSTCCGSASRARGVDADAVDRRGRRASRSRRRRGRWAPAARASAASRVGGEPRTTEEKIDDIAALNALTGANRTVSLHVPWDDPADPAALRAHADDARHRLRRDELEHVPGQPVDHRRRRGVLQVRVARQRRSRRAQARARAQPRGHRSRRAARLDRAHGLARRRHEPPGPGQLPTAVRARRRRPARAARLAAGRLGAVRRAQAVRAGVLLERQRRLGVVAAPRAARGASGRSASSTSGTTFPTRTSSRS